LDNCQSASEYSAHRSETSVKLWSEAGCPESKAGHDNDDDEGIARTDGPATKDEASHDLSRFLSFGKEGVLAGREFGDPIPTFRCLSVLPNAVVGRNALLAGIRTESRVKVISFWGNRRTQSESAEPCCSLSCAFGRYAKPVVGIRLRCLIACQSSFRSRSHSKIQKPQRGRSGPGGGQGCIRIPQEDMRLRDPG